MTPPPRRRADDQPTLLHDEPTFQASVDAARTAGGAPLRARSISGWRWPYLVAVIEAAVVAVLVLLIWLLPTPDGRVVALNLLVWNLALALAFLGGIHWGLGLRYAAASAQVPVFHIVWGPLPGLLAWITPLLPHAWAPVVLALLLGWALEVDRRVLRGAGLVAWLPMRIYSTAWMVAMCALTSLAALLGRV